MKAFVSFPFCIGFLSMAAARTLTVRNACSYTIWPALFTDPNTGSTVPNYPTGWEAGAGSSVSLDIPDNWTAGRVWGRRDCNFDSTGTGSCLDGGCYGGLECDPQVGTGAPPVTVAEFTLDASNVDYYDVSLVDGFNLPVEVNNSAGCGDASCPVDLLPNCPSPLQGPFDSTGSPVGCKSACEANIDGDPANSPNCCTGQHATPATCPPSGVAYYSYFKGNCPNSYVYAYDEGSTALWICPASSKGDFTVTFCP